MYLYCIACALCCPNGNFSLGVIRVAFPKESQLQQSRASQPLISYQAHTGLFCVSIIHRTHTGSLTCVRDHSVTLSHEIGQVDLITLEIIIKSKKVHKMRFNPILKQLSLYQVKSSQVNLFDQTLLG